MKTVLMLLTLWSLTGGALAQDAAAPQSEKSTGTTSVQLTDIPAGTVLAAELSKSLDAHKVKVGDPVMVKTTQDMLANGKVVIPHDSKIIGHITEVQGRPKGQKGEANSTVGIAFDQIMVKGGRQLPLHANIQAIAKPLQIASPPVGDDAATGGYGGGTMAGGSYPGRSPGAMPGTAPSPAPGAGTTAGPQEPGKTPDNSAGYPGAISVQSEGVIGMKGFSLNADDQGSVISSLTENVKLEGGTQLILKTKDK